MLRGDNIHYEFKLMLFSSVPVHRLSMCLFLYFGMSALAVYHVIAAGFYYALFRSLDISSFVTAYLVSTVEYTIQARRT